MDTSPGPTEKTKNLISITIPQGNDVCSGSNSSERHRCAVQIEHPKNLEVVGVDLLLIHRKTHKITRLAGSPTKRHLGPDLNATGPRFYPKKPGSTAVYLSASLNKMARNGEKPPVYKCDRLWSITFSDSKGRRFSIKKKSGSRRKRLIREPREEPAQLPSLKELNLPSPRPPVVARRPTLRPPPCKPLLSLATVASLFMAI